MTMKISNAVRVVAAFGMMAAPLLGHAADIGDAAAGKSTITRQIHARAPLNDRLTASCADW